MTSTKIQKSDTDATPAPSVIQPGWSVEAYRAGDPKVKGKIRSDLNKAFKTAFKSDRIEDARTIQNHLDALTADKPAKVEVPVEVTVAQRILDLRTAADLLEAGTVLPEGIESVDVDGLAEAYAVATVDTEAGTKIASAKITRSGKSNDVAQVILDALAAVPAGTVLTMAQVAGTVPGLSDGAVAARVYPASGKVTVPGIVPVPDHTKADGTPARGVRLA